MALYSSSSSSSSSRRRAGAGPTRKKMCVARACVRDDCNRSRTFSVVDEVRQGDLGSRSGVLDWWRKKSCGAHGTKVCQLLQAICSPCNRAGGLSDSPDPMLKVGRKTVNAQ